MAKKTKPASFEDFLEAPARVKTHGRTQSVGSGKPGRTLASHSGSPSSAKGPKVSPHKVKVGLTIDSDIIDAIDDYIYHERKQGKRLKKNDVYEAALRQFLGMKEGDAR